MPKFLESKLKKEYGADSSAPFAIMNKLGMMRGSKETPKGADAQLAHDSNDHDEDDAPKLVTAAKKKVVGQRKSSGLAALGKGM